jgi:hypothetical protein
MKPARRRTVRSGDGNAPTGRAGFTRWWLPPPETVCPRVEELARVTQGEFAAIREMMPTKDDIKQILLAIQGTDLHLSAYAQRWKDFERLEERVSRLEAKAGISKQ